MERKYVELANGRQVRRGPWFERNEVGIYVISETMLQEHGKQWGDCITILEIKIPADYFIGTLALPEIKIINKELWTEDLLAEVVRVLRQSTEDEKMLDHGETRVLCEKSSAYKKSIEYIITKLSGMFKEEKKLILEDGRRLIGDLEFKLGWDESHLLDIILYRF